MPYLKLQTNVALETVTRTNIMRQLSEDVAELLGKPEHYVMVAIDPQVDMLFAGNKSPAAYLELKSIGLPEHRTPEISQRLCTTVGGNLGIDKDRIYIEFADAQRSMWGWKGTTF
jgi:phenylpyruvate tautomerase